MTGLLRRGDWVLALRPDLGGAVSRLRHRGRDILRPTPDDAGDVLDTACFPLVPYANRIAHGTFDFDGERIRLPLNFGDHPHSLHGVGWRSAWTIDSIDADHAELAHRHPGNADWPWAYRARQLFRLRDDGLEVELELTNLDGRAMPGGIGLHPYVVAAPGALLRFASSRIWQSDDRQLPTHADRPDLLADWESGAPCRQDRLIDHCYSGWTGGAVIAAPSGDIVLTASGAHALHVHIPPGRGVVGLEPVSHIPDALNRPESDAVTGLRILGPGQSMRLTMRIALREA